ncbi:SdiA-regulated domain-containing protein [Hyalangium versicolor]|uniref:SdiA-regulated domain-containing protein n=1 Tax=Hyalangium versicolor TaxID=2861190 RepID=UPI001CC95ABC|nr:SdiA-regulated domain-containing protein [Hyalangium versicolor]
MPSDANPPPVQVRPLVARRELADLPFRPGAKATAVLSPNSKAVKEPSGIVFHPTRGTLFVVGDHGDVAELTRDGQVLHQTRIKDHGFEGVTVGPDGRVFVIEEKKSPKLYALDPDSLEIQAEYEVETKLEGKRVIGKHGNKSTEGLCYVPEQRAFYCINQHPARLVKLDVPLTEKEGKARAVEVIDLSDIVEHQASDVTYDTASGHFLITESGSGKEEGRVYELTREGKRVREATVPGARAEGLALDGSGRAFIADDAGGVLRVDP